MSIELFELQVVRHHLGNSLWLRKMCRQDVPGYLAEQPSLSQYVSLVWVLDNC